MRELIVIVVILAMIVYLNKRYTAFVKAPVVETPVVETPVVETPDPLILSIPDATLLEIDSKINNIPGSGYIVPKVIKLTPQNASYDRVIGMVTLRKSTYNTPADAYNDIQLSEIKVVTNNGILDSNDYSTKLYIDGNNGTFAPEVVDNDIKTFTRKSTKEFSQEIRLILANPQKILAIYLYLQSENDLESLYVYLSDANFRFIESINLAFV